MSPQMEKLKSDLKSQAELCKKNKTECRAAQRDLSRLSDNPNATWQDARNLANTVGRARGASFAAAWKMTMLCVYRAHLRGRKHLSANSSDAFCEEGFIDAAEEIYGLLSLREESAR